MNVTAKDIISRSFSEVVQSKHSPSPIDYSDCMRYLNRMMAKFETNSITIGYTPVSSLSDVITVPFTCVLAIVKNLAVALWPQYTTIGVNPVLGFSAKRGIDILLSHSINEINPSAHPYSLPIGSAGQCLYDDDNKFFGDESSRSIYISSE